MKRKQRLANSRVEKNKKSFNFIKFAIAVSSVIGFLTGIADFIKTVIEIIKELN
ncbi:hypothetical protein M4L90_12115 [Staphylococcus equorum]|uniref:Uncharacterized protein n=1 Tax=Staphylococcus equorum TaxID=246432 RepID=A0A9X4QZN5_9STAP|nr:hypothetical protein [Staphylococcus equorum]MDG0820664.1 hypothetical protein [Staphylococcus equorum]MDG0841289.1 hypothetical protein [Staphylococcus equorum]MDG0846989.1 hypothetical protein [Staphylococcus equorum]